MQPCVLPYQANSNMNLDCVGNVHRDAQCSSAFRVFCGDKPSLSSYLKSRPST